MSSDETPHPAPRASADSARDRWTWKPEERERLDELGLLYEPGNWGDILKGTWALIVTTSIANTAARDAPVRVLDPWAGARSYPALEPVRRRLEELGPTAWTHAQEPWLARDRIASTATLVLDALAGAGRAVRARVFDADAARLATWSESREIEGSRQAATAALVTTEILAATDGQEALESGCDDSDLVLVDPYDFFTTWSRLLPIVLPIAARAPTLIYLYNKAPRGGAQVRQYRAMRDRLERASVNWVIGRTPSDAILPRAFHEMWLLGPAELVSSLRPALKRATRRLACKLSTSGSFESAD